MNWTDAVIIVVLLIFMAFGIKKGFMFSVIDLFGFFVNFVIALFLTNPMRNLLGIMGMENGITNNLYQHYAGFGSNFTQDLTAITDGRTVSTFVSDTINESPLSGFSKRLFNGTINNHLAEKLADKSNVTLADIMSKSVAQFITVVVAFLICFILLYVLLLILKIISKKMQESSFVNVWDKIFGGVFGLVRGAMFFVLIFAVLSFFSDNGFLAPVMNYINQSAIGGWLRTSVNTFMINYIDIKQAIIDFLQKL